MIGLDVDAKRKTAISAAVQVAICVSELKEPGLHPFRRSKEPPK